MDSFSLLKLNRAVWISFLEQENISEAVTYFEAYRCDLLNFRCFSSSVKKALQLEIENSLKTFLFKLLELATSYFKNKEYAKALLCYAVIYKYDQKLGVKNYIICLKELKQYDLALSLIDEMSAEIQEDSLLLKAAAEIYDECNNNVKSVEYFEKYLKSKSGVRACDYNQLGCYYNKLYTDNTHNLEDLKTSLDYFLKAAELNPDSALYLKNTTITATRANDFKLAKKYWKCLFELDELTNDDKFDYSAFCLRTSDFDGWHKYVDARFLKEHNPSVFPKIDKPEWKGQDLSESTLLVHYEQGFGDTFLMFGYMDKIAKLAKHVIFVCQDGVADLLNNNDFGVEVIDKSNADLKKLKFDYYIPSMSIPVVLKLKGRHLCAGSGYIRADKDLAEKYRKKYFNNNKFKIGIAFRGNATGNITRDVPLKTFLPLCKMKNVALYILTKDVNSDECKVLKGCEIINIAENFKSFSDTAAAIENCDIVISGDNGLMNLSGAMGKKTYTLFNWHYEFRYFDLSGDDIVWLNSVKPYVCETVNGWDLPMKKIADEINKIRQ